MSDYYRFKVKGIYLKLTTDYQFIIRNTSKTKFVFRSI